MKFLLQASTFPRHLPQSETFCPYVLYYIDLSIVLAVCCSNFWNLSKPLCTLFLWFCDDWLVSFNLKHSTMLNFLYLGDEAGAYMVRSHVIHFVAAVLVFKAFMPIQPSYLDFQWLLLWWFSLCMPQGFNFAQSFVGAPLVSGFNWSASRAHSTHEQACKKPMRVRVAFSGLWVVSLNLACPWRQWLLILAFNVIATHIVSSAALHGFSLSTLCVERFRKGVGWQRGSFVQNSLKSILLLLLYCKDNGALDNLMVSSSLWLSFRCLHLSLGWLFSCIIGSSPGFRGLVAFCQRILVHELLDRWILVILQYEHVPRNHWSKPSQNTP